MTDKEEDKCPRKHNERTLSQINMLQGKIDDLKAGLMPINDLPEMSLAELNARQRKLGVKVEKNVAIAAPVKHNAPQIILP